MSLPEKKIQNLADDESFLKDLREGNFILVLGAGFSFGIDKTNRIKNITNHSNPIYQNIPLTDEFIEITKAEFNNNNASDFPSAVAEWEVALENENERRELFRNLFLINENEFIKTNYEHYRNILTPKWYRIFTFNFDNVFETVYKLAGQKNKYNPLSYPKDKEFTSNTSKTEIAHIHGEITHDSTVTDIVFFGNKYAALQNSQNDFYFSLLNSIDPNSQKRNLIIIGCQFNEHIQLQKFYSQIQKNDNLIKPKIYQFGLNQPKISGMNEYLKLIDYSFIKASTFDFLQFLKETKDKIENIQIEGSEVITTSFVKIIRDGKEFSKADFYTAKQNENCQWYGVINKYDVERNDYEKIKIIASSCFDKPKFDKVAAVVHGFGGCGKSTLLRRLAVELCNESFKIVWIKDGGFNNFTNTGLAQIQADPSRNYLVIVEDWYRLTYNLIEKAKEFLLKTQSIPNLRIIIGDREINGKEYINNLPEKENKFHLKAAEENEIIIGDIIAKHNEWKPAKEKVIRTHDDYNSSLFLLLFVIARVSSEEFGASIVDFSEPRLAFVSIVKSDLKKINYQYPGFAKTLYIWGCIYKNYKLLIPYETFLRIADIYNGNNDIISKSFTNWNAQSVILDRIKNYINIGKHFSLRNKKLRKIDFVQFNHDKLAEEGLTDSALDDWQAFYDPDNNKYDDILLKEFLNNIIDKGDDYISSLFLATMLKHQKQIFTDGKEKLFYINLLFKKNNRFSHYLNVLTDEDINLTPSQIKVYLDILSMESVYPTYVWLGYFKKAHEKEKQAAAKKILVDDNITSLPSGIVVAAFNQPYNEKEKQAAAKKILVDDNITSLPSGIVVAAFNQPYNKGEKQAAAKIILVDENITSIPYAIVLAAFNQPENKEEKQAAAKKILVDENITSIPSGTVVAAFNQPGNKEEKQAAVKKILVDENITSIPSGTVVAAFNQPGNKEEKQAAVKKILVDENISLIQPDIAVAAFNQPYNKEEKQVAAEKILVDENITSLPSGIVAAAFNQPENKEEKQSAANKILTLRDWKKKTPILIYASLKTFSGDDNIPIFISKKVSELVVDYLNNKKDRTQSILFAYLMRIPFHNIKIWEDASIHIIKHWKYINRGMVTCVLFGYHNHPDRIKYLCVSILDNWREELAILITLYYGKPRRGDHIKEALGHPQLKKLSKKTAEEIVKAKEERTVDIPDYLFEIADNIIKEDSYPEWDQKKDNESTSK